MKDYENKYQALKTQNAILNKEKSELKSQLDK